VSGAPIREQNDSTGVRALSFQKTSMDNLYDFQGAGKPAVDFVQGQQDLQ